MAFHSYKYPEIRELLCAIFLGCWMTKSSTIGISILDGSIGNPYFIADHFPYEQFQITARVKAYACCFGSRNILAALFRQCSRR